MKRKMVRLLTIGAALLVALCGCSSTSGPDDGTPSDTQPPTVSLTYPPDGAVIGDSVIVSADAADVRSVASVEFRVDGVTKHTDTSPPYQYAWDASAEALGSDHTLYARARDAAGNEAGSSVVTVFCTWKPLVLDADDPWETDIARVYARRTASTLEFRVETHGDWSDPHDWDGGINVAVFLDVDCSQATGLSSSTPGWYEPNDIGADFGVAVGATGDTVWMWEAADTAWVQYADLEYLDLPDVGNSFEVGVALSDIGDPGAVDVVVANVHSGDWDWAPDAGHRTVQVDDLYIGRASEPPVARQSRQRRSLPAGPLFGRRGPER